MKKRINFKKQLSIFLGTAGLVSGVLASAITLPQNNISTNQNLSNTSSNKQADASTTASYVTPAGIKNDGTFDLANMPAQYKAVDDSNSGFAILTSDTQYTSATGSYNLDEITKYDTTSVTGDSGTITKAAGTVDWVITKTDLQVALGGTTLGNNMKIAAIMYSSGGYQEFKSLFAIVNTDTQSLLFRIYWTSQTIGGVSHTGGEVQFVQDLHPNAGSTLIQYNSLALESPSTHTIQVMQLPSAISSLTSNITINYGTVSSSTFTNANGAGTAFVNQTLQMSSTDLQANFASGVTYHPTFVQKVNASVFVIFSAETYTDADASKAVVMINPTISSNTASFTSANYNSISLANSGFNANSTYKVNVLSTSTTSFNLVVSDSSSSSTGNLVTASLNLNNFSAAVTTNTVQDVVLKTTATGGLANSFISEVSPVYTINSSNISYYIGLTSDNLAIELDTSFNYVTTLYDFNKSSIANMGKIWNIYTKSGDSNWYAQMTDGTFAEFTDSTFIGQWDTILQNESQELPVNISILEQSQISSTILYQKVANDQNNGYDSTFTTFLSSATAYENFLTINFQDPRLNGQLPDIRVIASSFSAPTDGSKTYSVTLTFQQNLREIDANGNVETTSQTTNLITLGSKTYTFNNNIGTITPATGYIDQSSTDKTPVDTDVIMPTYVTSMMPSQVAQLINQDTSDNKLGADNYAVVNNIVQIENADGASFYASGSDSTGVLTLTVSVPAFWTSSGSTATLNTPYSKTYVFGTSTTPYFNFNPFGSDAATSVTEKDATYFSDTSNASDVASLESKYSTILPSNADPMDLFNDFFVLGSAFTNESNLSSGSIVMPTSDNIQVIPFDSQGYAYISVTFPKIGNQQDVRYSFQTPAIFLKDQFAKSSTYFVWNDSNVANMQLNGTSLSTTKASSIANMINQSSTSPSSLDGILKTFASYSNNFLNLFSSVTATADDTFGMLTIQATLSQDAINAGYSQNDFVTSFSGFQQSGTSTSQATSFSFSTIDSSNSIFSMSPSQVTAADLINAGNITLPSGYSADQMNYYVTLTPSNSTGTLGVAITFDNWVETQNGATTQIPKKTFTETLKGFVKSGIQNSMLVWKSIDDISSQLTSITPSNVITTLSTQSGLTLLQNFANISYDLSTKLNDNNVNVYLIPDNDTGSLTVSTTLNINGAVQSFSTTISGFKSSSSLDPNVVIVPDTQSNASLLAAIKQKLPSQVTIADLTSLYSLSNYDSSNWKLSITLEPDDATGMLTVSYKFDSLQSSGYSTSPQTITYSGLKTYVPDNKGTNWGVVAACIIVPLVVFITPIFIFGYVQTRRDMKKIARRLDRRLEEERKKEKRRRNYQL